MGDWRVKYDGCSRCGVALPAGELAVYDRPTRTIHCVTCPTSADREPEAIDAGVAGRSARHEHDQRAAKRETVVNVSIRLTPSAYAHGLAVACPPRLLWRARQCLDSGHR